MAYIYCITNKINGKLYVGKTENTIDERWKEHKQEYKKERCEKRPLYNAMKKYGIDNFEIKELEYLKEGGKLLSDREIYWILLLGTYGCNATKGGDGSTLYNHEEIIKVYQKVNSIKQTAKLFNCTIDTVRDILNSNNINVEKRIKCQTPKSVEQYSLDGELLNTFNSLMDAGRYIKSIIETTNTINKIASKIGDCALGKQKTAYKYIWKFKD